MAGMLLAGGTALAADPAPTTADLFKEHCGECHGAERLGGMGPALIPENLKRLRKPAAIKVVTEGRAQTQMAGFAEALSKEQIAALVDYIYTPLAEMPQWGEAEIKATHSIVTPREQLAAKPVYDTDMMNLFIVVEMGDSHITLLDGNSFEPITRFPTHHALHGGPKYSPDGRFVYLASRSGWITKYDLWGLVVVAEVRAGINTRNLAISGDGKTVMVANYLPHTLAIFDAEDLSLLKLVEVKDRQGKKSSRVSAVYQAEPRDAFIVALKDIPEVWEISWLEKPPPVYSGFVHDYRMGEGMVEKGRFPINRIRLEEPLDDFFFDPDYIRILGSARDGSGGVVVDLDLKREMAKIPLSGLPHLGSGITWQYGGHRFIATPNLKDAGVSVIDMDKWRLVGVIETLGPGIFMRSHENTPYAWVDNSFSKHKDTIQIIDKASLKIVGQVTPVPGKTANHVEFSRDGKYALVSVSEDDGSLVVYEADTFKEIKRLPMRKPMGKYNVFNKITRSEGTSH